MKQAKYILGPGWFAGVLIGCVMSIFLSGCSMGGGTLGTGVNSYGTDGKAGAINFSIEGVVHDEKSHPYPNASVSIFTSRGEERAISNKKGRYLVPVAFTGGEEVEIVVQRGGAQWSCKRFISPEGQDFVTVNLTIQAKGRLHCK